MYPTTARGFISAALVAFTSAACANDGLTNRQARVVDVMGRAARDPPAASLSTPEGVGDALSGHDALSLLAEGADCRSFGTVRISARDQSASTAKKPETFSAISLASSRLTLRFSRRCQRTAVRSIRLSCDERLDSTEDHARGRHPRGASGLRPRTPTDGAGPLQTADIRRPSPRDRRRKLLR